MKKRLLDYIAQTEGFLAGDFSLEAGEAALADLILQIRFFAHERLAHLLVTLFFALLLVLGILFFHAFPSIPVFLLSVAFLALLVPYIRHYYILENGTQRLYALYDELNRKVNERKFREKPMD